MVYQTLLYQAISYEKTDFRHPTAGQTGKNLCKNRTKQHKIGFYGSGGSTALHYTRQTSLAARFLWHLQSLQGWAHEGQHGKLAIQFYTTNHNTPNHNKNLRPEYIAPNHCKVHHGGRPQGEVSNYPRLCWSQRWPGTLILYTLPGTSPGTSPGSSQVQEQVVPLGRSKLKFILRTCKHWNHQY